MEEFLNVLIQQFECFWVLALNRRSHIHADLFNSYFFICYLAAPWPILSHYQEDSLNHPMLITAFFIIFCLRGHWQPYNNKLLKTWDGLQWDSQTHRVTETKANWWTHTKKIYIEKILPVLNDGSADREYLHYRIYVERDTLKVSLHCCKLIWDKANSNCGNKNFHQCKFYMRLPSLLLTK